MRTKLLIMLFVFAAFVANAQDEPEWKPQTHITGYVNTIAEYTNLQNWVDAKQNIGIGLSEAAFLASYKPLKKLEFKGTFVYTHYVKSIQALLVEGYASYTVNKMFKLSAGKYLTPLSPVNQYFYAPMNPSASLPSVVSHHNILPQSIAGFQVSGEFGTDLKAGYNVTYGNYFNVGHTMQGILGVQGIEDLAVYLTTDPDPKASYLLGGSSRVYGNYRDIINVGFNYFDGRRSSHATQVLTATGVTTSYKDATKYSMGIDMQLKLGDLKVTSEYWIGHQETTDPSIQEVLGTPILSDFKSYYAEMMYEKGAFRPYVRYDYISDIPASVYSAFPDNKLFDVNWETTTATVGIAYRPIYEVLLKLEYSNIDTKTNYGNVNIPAALEPVFPLGNPLKINVDKYDFFRLSLVYSF